MLALVTVQRASYARSMEQPALVLSSPWKPVACAVWMGTCTRYRGGCCPVLHVARVPHRIQLLSGSGVGASPISRTYSAG